MTIVEFFDNTSIENIASALTCNPDRVILVGNDRDLMDKYIGIYSELAVDRNLKTIFLPKSINRNDPEIIMDALTEIIEIYDDCIFDLEGGDELFLVTVGALANKYPDRVHMHRFNISNNTVHDTDLDGEIAQVFSMEISVEENIKIYGGRFADPRFGKFNFVFDEEFNEDVRKLWEICKKNPKDWNLFSTSIITISDACFLGTSVIVNQTTAGSYWKTIVGRINKTYLFKLSDKGLINNLRSGTDGLYFDFKNEQIKRCIVKNGEVLELYITILAKSLHERIGKPVYNDVRNAVIIDWDGFDDDIDYSEDEFRTINEIDVILMKGMVPVFISCKNGATEVNELYKLSTVAERFGGKYAKKVLIISDLYASSPVPEHILTRADDMDIKVICDAAKLSEEDLEDKIRHLWHD